MLLLKAAAGREQKERWKGDMRHCRCSWSVRCPQCPGLWCGDKSRVMRPLLLGAHPGSTQHRQQPWPRLQKFCLGSLLSRFSVRSEHMEFKTLKEKKGKPLIVKGLPLLVLSDQPCTQCRTPCAQQGLIQPQPLQVARCWRKGAKINLFLIALGMQIFC